MDTTADRTEVPSVLTRSGESPPTTRDEDRPLADEPTDDDLSDFEVPFDAPVPDVLEQHRDVPLDEEGSR